MQGRPNGSTSTGADSNFVSHATADALVKSRCVDHNLDVLTNLLGYWKNKVSKRDALMIVFIGHGLSIKISHYTG